MYIKTPSLIEEDALKIAISNAVIYL